MRLAHIAALACFGLTATCGTTQDGRVIIDVKTDLVPTLEFTSVEVIRPATGDGMPVSVASQDWIAGVRAGDFMGVEPGGAFFDVRILLGTTVVLERRATVDVRGDTAVTVLLTRDCRGVECPDAGGSPSAIACLGARCVEPECLTGAEPECPPAACELPTDCSVSATCAAALCESGTCVQTDAGTCGADQACDPDEGCVRTTPLPFSRSTTTPRPSGEDGDLFASSVATTRNATWLVVGTPGDDGVTNADDNSAPAAGGAFVFAWDDATDDWTAPELIRASNAEASDAFGGFVAMSGDESFIAVAAPMEASGDGTEPDNGAPGAGCVYVFARVGDMWVQQAYLKAALPSPDDGFGVVAFNFDGSVLVVGAPGEDSGSSTDDSDESAPDAGAVFVFSRAGDVWMPDGYIKPEVIGAGDGFGSALALDESGNVLIVGAPGEDGGAVGFDGDASDDSAEDSGAAYVFERLGTTWTQLAYVKASNAESGDAFGSSVAVNSFGLFVVGAPGEASASGLNGDATNNSMPGAGAAYAFNRSDRTQVAYLKPSNPGEGASFGAALAMSNSSPVDVLVGAPGESSASSDEGGVLAESGATYVMTGGIGGWRERQFIKAPTPVEGAHFGASVAIGFLLAIGAPDDVVGADRTGRIHTFTPF